MEQAMLEAREVSRTYGGQTALDRVSLAVKPGEIYGLLGPNGAGKTTLMKVRSGLLRPDSGTALAAGLNVEEHREQVMGRLGLLIETPCFYDHLSAADNLAVHLAYMGVDGDIPGALELAGLSGAGGKPVGRFSLGMRQRLAIARAVIHRPAAVLLDEPVNGLDPVAVVEMRGLFRRLAAEGMALLISSHMLSEVEHTVHRVGVLYQGRLVLEEGMDALKAAHPGDLEDYLVTRMRGGRA